MLKNIFEELYYRSPVLLQNIAISLYGVKVRHSRNAGLYSRYYADSCTRLAYSSKEMSKYANSELSRVIRLASEKVPYYREVFHQCGVRPDDISGVNELYKIPLLEKSTIKARPSDFINEDYDVRNLAVINTTGSTGTPLKVYCTANVRRKNYAVYDRFLTQAGITASDRKATLGGRIVMPSFVTKPPYWRYNATQSNMLFSSYHLSDENMPCYIDKLLSYRPGYIDSYPSSIYSVADYARKQGLNLRGITRAITTSGETLYDNQRSVIEDVFGVRIYDQYGAAEMCLFIGECSSGCYHIHSDFGVVELIDDNGKAALPGEEAEVVCTGFINDVMPLIRYRIGDRAIVGKGQCDCGSPFPVISEILGRNDDVIITPEGNRVGRLSPVLKGFPVKEAQYAQSDISKVVVKLVVEDNYTPDAEKAFVVELRKRLGDSIEIECCYVDAIERGKGAKFKSILSTMT